MYLLINYIMYLLLISIVLLIGFAAFRLGKLSGIKTSDDRRRLLIDVEWGKMRVDKIQKDLSALSDVRKELAEKEIQIERLKLELATEKGKVIYHRSRIERLSKEAAEGIDWKAKYTDNYNVLLRERDEALDDAGGWKDKHKTLRDENEHLKVALEGCRKECCEYGEAMDQMRTAYNEATIRIDNMHKGSIKDSEAYNSLKNAHEVAKAQIVELRKRNDGPSGSALPFPNIMDSYQEVLRKLEEAMRRNYELTKHNIDLDNRVKQMVKKDMSDDEPARTVNIHINNLVGKVNGSNSQTVIDAVQKALKSAINAASPENDHMYKSVQASLSVAHKQINILNEDNKNLTEYKTRADQRVAIFARTIKDIRDNIHIDKIGIVDEIMSDNGVSFNDLIFYADGKH